MALGNLTSLPFVQLISAQIDTAVARGRDYLLCTSAIDAKYFELKELSRIDKISCVAETLHMSYVISALHIPILLYSSTGKLDAFLPSIPLEKINQFLKFYKQMPMFKVLEDWQLNAYLIESYLFLSVLTKVRLDIFDRNGWQPIT